MVDKRSPGGLELGPELTLVIGGPHRKAQVVREELARGLQCLLQNTLYEDKPMDNEEVRWATDALSWINWHAGRTGGMPLIEGNSLVNLMPERATR